MKPKVKEIQKYYINADRILRELFDHKMKSVQDDITNFRDLLMKSETNYDDLKVFISNVDTNLAICTEIINHNVLKDI